MSKAETKQTGQTIETLRSRYEKLNETRIKVQAQRDNAQEQLEKLRQNAVEQFGTDDLDALRTKLVEIKKQNEQQRAEYETSLDEIEAKLEKVDLESDKEAEE